MQSEDLGVWPPDRHTLQEQQRVCINKVAVNKNREEGKIPGIRAFSERYVFFASEGSSSSAIMPAKQHITLIQNGE